MTCSTMRAAPSRRRRSARWWRTTTGTEAAMPDSLMLEFSGFDTTPWYARPAVPRVLGPAGYRRAKRCLDLVICLALLPVVVPVLLLCAIAIRLDSPGPVVFFQYRTGKGGR